MRSPKLQQLFAFSVIFTGAKKVNAVTSRIGSTRNYKIGIHAFEPDSIFNRGT